MKWTSQRLPQIRNIIDRYKLYDRIAVNNLTLIQGFGSPCTIWNNVAITSTGSMSQNLTRCYCWDDQKTSPDKTHFLCFGSGFLGGYQKYGYNEIVFSTPSPYTPSSTSIVIGGTRGSTFMLSGTSLSESVTTERYHLDKFKEIDYFLANDDYDATQSRIEYQYSVDDATWVDIPVYGYSESPIANRRGILSINEEIEYIRFRIILKKRFSNSASPKFNSIRFRYRNLLKLSEIDNRYNINIPAFIASREPATQQIRQGNTGWESYFPIRWKTLPDALVENGDVIMFLNGEFSNLKFEVKELVRYTYGPSLQVLHRSFESVFVRDSKDLLGIVYYFI